VYHQCAGGSRDAVEDVVKQSVVAAKLARRYLPSSGQRRSVVDNPAQAIGVLDEIQTITGMKDIGIVTLASMQDIGVRPAFQQIISRTAFQVVLAHTAAERVGQETTIKTISLVSPTDRVGGGYIAENDPGVVILRQGQIGK